MLQHIKNCSNDDFMWPLLVQALYKRMLHRLCLNIKRTFVGNTCNKVLTRDDQK